MPIDENVVMIWRGDVGVQCLCCLALFPPARV